MSPKLVSELILLFLATQVLGLAVANVLIKENVRVTILTDNPEDIENAFALFGYILFVTAIFILIITFVKVRGITMLFEILALSATSTLVFAALLPDVALLFTAVIIMLRLSLRENAFVKNLSSTIATAGAGALIGISLGVVPVVAFLAILCMYDYIAVFKTKHMVKMAEAITRDNAAFTFSLPSKERTYQLGTGDLVMPLVFATSIMAKTKNFYPAPYYLVPVALVLFASILGLFGTFFYLTKKRHALPALPLQGILMIATWLTMAFSGLKVI